MILEKIQIKQPLPDAQTIDSEWEALDRAITRKQKTRVTIKRTFRWSAIAASITILLMVGLFFHRQEQSEPDYLSMLDPESSELLTNPQIQLYLNHQEVLSLPEHRFF